LVKISAADKARGIEWAAILINEEDIDMALDRTFRRASRIFFIAALLFILGLVYIFLDTYYFSSARTVSNRLDPRWRVFDFHSRQAAESEIYSVAEVPAVKKVRLVSARRLRFEFHAPFDRTAWKVIDEKGGSSLSQGGRPEIPFPDTPYRGKYRLIAEGASMLKDVLMEIDFYPKENYQQKNLSWRDNYWLVSSSIPFTTRRLYRIAEWVGLGDKDPELEMARQILGDRIRMDAPAVKKAEQVFLFVMDAIKNSGGTPDDRLQAASPLETYERLIGQGKGFCENRALVYYLFANAAGVPTRLIDLAGKFGPLKLTGHYFCESFLPEIGAWIYVDPQFGAARAVLGQDRLLNTLDLKKLSDLNALSEVTFFLYDTASGALTAQPAGDPSPYLTGDLVIAYKFGYGRTKSFSKLKNFMRYPTLLYATFPVPGFFRVRQILTGLFVVSAALALVFSLGGRLVKKGRFF
jgi:hypothetical protein